jgi:hypothetical protein
VEGEAGGHAKGGGAGNEVAAGEVTSPELVEEGAEWPGFGLLNH